MASSSDDTTRFIIHQVEQRAAQRYASGWHARMSEDQQANRQFLVDRLCHLPRFVEGQLITGSYIHRKIATELLLNDALQQCPNEVVGFSASDITLEAVDGYVVCEAVAQDCANIKLWREPPFTLPGDSEPTAQAFGIAQGKIHEVIEELAYACQMPRVAMVEACGRVATVFAADHQDGPAPMRFAGTLGPASMAGLTQPMTVEAYIHEKLPRTPFRLTGNQKLDGSPEPESLARLCTLLEPTGEPWRDTPTADYFHQVMDSVKGGRVPIRGDRHTWEVAIHDCEIRSLMPQQLRYLLVARVAGADPDNVGELIHRWAPFARKGVSGRATSILGWLEQVAPQVCSTPTETVA